MGKPIIKNKILIFSLIILLSTISIIVYSIMIINSPSNKIDTQSARLLINDCIYKAENNNFENIDKYTYTIFDLKGTIVKSNDKKYIEGSTINIKTLSGLQINENSNTLVYTAPFTKDNLQIGTIVVKTNTSDFTSKNITPYIPIFLLGLTICISIFLLIKTVKKDILGPINEIHNCAINIIKGNLDERIYYDYDGEIGELCHDFEALRLNLSYSLSNEKKLKEKEKLLLAYISHDLRTPIASISGYAEGINSGIVNDEKSIKEYTDIILKKTKMLNKLIDDILTHSKAQLNEFSIFKEECYAKDFFLDILNESKKDVESNNLSFTHNNIPDVLINIDKIRIKQVMQNLINNAIKFSKEQGEIKVNFKLFQNYLLISVIDNGIGISASDLPMIFHEFYRGEKSRTLNVPGSGLGLSISKYIVEKHDGQIECDSVLNDGTTITFSLPY